MQLGFVIDQTRCIGCHACTVACKSENDVPVGDFRTWVKYTESGSFPAVRRGFSVLRCNQCTEAPCVEICPVTALSKHENGIVDVDPTVCIGCKGCTHACPYDAIYINAESGIAEKCHFCEHRTERGLAPACAVVCPTEAITETKLFEFSFTNRSDAIYTKAELLVDAETGRPRQLPWEDWREGEDEMTSAWMRATSASGDVTYSGRVAWSAELGYGVRAPEVGQAGDGDDGEVDGGSA